jgi:hypothetical protein
MARLCARSGCSAPAAATFNFDSLNRIVWLSGLAESRACSAGDLCWRHAERLRPPRNWEVRDRRNTAVLRPGAAAPSRQYPPPSVTPGEEAPRPGGVDPERQAAPVLKVPATTPLLARAFRGVSGA